MTAEHKPRVLIVHNRYQQLGGEEIVVENERRLLESHGHKVTLYTRDSAELKDCGTLRKLTLPFETLFSLRTYADVRRLILQEGVEIVHVHNTLPLISPSVYYAAFSRRVPVVQTVHNFRFICPGAMLYRDGRICEDCLKGGLGCAVRHSCYRSSRAQTLLCVISMRLQRMLRTYGRLSYICMTEFCREKLLTLGQIKPERVFIKSNFVDSAAASLPLERRENRFIYAGRLDELKGLRVLLEAWRLLGPDAPKLLVCGTGPMEGWCREYIDENQLSSVELMGFVPHERVMKLIGASLALIMPTLLYEGAVALPVIEAYTAGTAVIGSSQGNIGSAIDDGVSGIKFDCRSAESLSGAVRRFLDKPFAVPDEYREKYSSEENYRRLRKIYASL